MLGDTSEQFTTLVPMQLMPCLASQLERILKLAASAKADSNILARNRKRVGALKFGANAYIFLSAFPTPLGGPDSLHPAPFRAPLSLVRVLV